MGRHDIHQRGMFALINVWLLSFSAASGFQSPPALLYRGRRTPFCSRRGNFGAAPRSVSSKQWTTTTAMTASSTATAPKASPKTKSSENKSNAKRKTQKYHLIPKQHVKQNIQEAKERQEDFFLLKQNNSRHWISSFFALLTKWARIGDGQAAQDCLERIGESSSLSPPIQVEARRRVLHAWCNQAKRTTMQWENKKRFPKSVRTDLWRYMKNADETLQIMETINQEHSTNNESSLLTKQDYVVLLQTQTRCGHALQSLETLKRLEQQYKSSNYNTTWAPSVAHYSSVVRSLANSPRTYAPNNKEQQLVIAQVAQDAAESCIDLYNATGAPGLNQDLRLYNAVLEAWSKEFSPPKGKTPLSSSSSVEVLKQVQVTQSALGWWNKLKEELQPDTKSYTLLLYTYCKCGMVDQAYSLWEELMERLTTGNDDSKKELVDVRSFSMLVQSLSRKIALEKDDDKDVAIQCAERIGHVVNGRWKLHEMGYPQTAPNKFLYTTAISSWAAVNAPESLQRAEEWFMDLEFKSQSTAWESLRPDVAVYNGLVNAHAKHLQQMDTANGNNSTAYLAAADKAESLVKQMEKMSKTKPHVRPDTITYSTLVDAHLRAAKATPGETKSIQQAEDILFKVLHEYKESKDERIKPSVKLFANIIRAWAACSVAGSAAKAQALLAPMEEYFGPKSQLYNDVIFAWCREAKEALNGSHAEAVLQAQGLLFRMEELYKDMNYPTFRPSIELYNAVIDAWLVVETNGYEQAKLIRQRRDDMYLNDEAIAQEEMTFANDEEVFSLLGQLDESGNEKQLLKAKSFNALLSLLAKSSKPWAAQRAQDVLDYMLETNSTMADIVSFNHVMNAWAKSSNPEGAIRAEAVLDRLNYLHENDILPDVVADRVSYNTVINAYAKSSEPLSAQEAERVFEALSDLYESTKDEDYRPDLFSYTSLINAWANSDESIAAKRAEDILLGVIQDHKADPSNVKPNTMCFNAVLHAWATTRDEEAPRKAEILIRLMEDLYIGGGNDDVQPDTQSYNIVLNALARSQDGDGGTKAIELLEKMREEHRNGNEAVKPDITTYKTVINAVASVGGKASLEGIGTLLEEVYDDDDLGLDVTFFSSLIGSLARTGAKGSVWLAEQIVAVLKQMNANGVTQVTPDNTVYNALLHCWAKSGERTAMRRAEDILNFMEAEFQRGKVYMKPNFRTYASVIDVIAKSRSPDVEKAEEIFSRMQKKFEAGDYGVRPNCHAYTALIQTYARSELADKAMRAQDILQRMKDDYESGNASAEPSVMTYNAVLNSCEHAWFGDDKDAQDSFQVACSTFDEMRSSSSCRPNHVTYGTFLGVCGELMPNSDVRSDMLKLVFRRCCAEGQVGPVVLKKLREASSPSMYYRLVGVENELPEKWTANVKERQT